MFINDKNKLVVNVAQLGRVVVLYGGMSFEREVSLKSGRAVFDALVRKGCDVDLVDVKKNFLALLSKNQESENPWKHAFIVLHGVGGEDGVMQGVLEMAGIPYTGSGVLASALAMNKWRTKQLWMEQGLSTPAYEILCANTSWNASIERLGGTAIVKPACEGSSIGMRKATSGQGLREAYLFAQQYPGVVLAEAWISGQEYTVSILNGEVLPAIRLETDSDFYDFDAKYVSNDTRYLCPCGLSSEKEKELQRLALSAFNAIGCSGWGRVDVMSDKAGKFYLLEVNTVPGMTDHSLVPKSAAAKGIGFDELVMQILSGGDQAGKKG